MYRYLTLFIKITYLLLLLFIACCSNKNQSINTEISDSDTINFDNVYSTTLSNNSLADTSSNKQAQKKDLNNWLPSKSVKVLNENFYYSASLPKNITFPKVNNVFLINTVPNYSTSFEFYQKFFSNYEIIGYSIFIYHKSFKLKYIERVAKTKGANLVIIKKVYNKEKENYVYDILYLKGQLYSHDYWMRNSNEAIPISITLDSIKKSKKGLNNDYLNSNLKIKNPDSIKHNPSVQYKENTLLQTLNKNIDSFFKLMQETEEDEDTLKDKPINTLDKAYKDLESRVDNIVGLWMDSYDKTIVRIQEISSETIKKYDAKSFLDSKIKYYGAYIEFKDDYSKQKYNSSRRVNTDERLLWHNNDLKFQFNSTGNNSIYLNYNKMPIPAFIKAFPAKGVLIVNLPNGEVRYYIPIDFINIKPEILKQLYNKQPSIIKEKETSLGNGSFSAGYGLYGWIFFSGLALLGLGIISFI